MNESIAVRVTETSQAGEARRAAADLSVRACLHENDRARLALVVTELANNLVKHATNGEIFLRILHEDGRTGVEVLAVDSGPGIEDVDACMQDGYSTAGTPGNGLGAVKRRSDKFEIYTRSGSGTVMAASVIARQRQSQPDANSHSLDFLIGAVCRPVFGEVECGDAWAIRCNGRRARVIIADGLGHGPGAAEASNGAVEIFNSSGDCTLTDLIQNIHVALRSTRGAALAAADIDLEKGTLRFAGIGNISGFVLSDEPPRGLMSHSGTVGHLYRRVQELDYVFPSDGLLVLHSDGVQTRWSLEGRPGLLHQDPSLIAGVIYRDFKRARDDATVLAIRGAIKQ